jgi:gliding motility-associated-like protein
VPNPSFEDFTNCPTYSQLFYASPWIAPTDGTSDYFNPCNSSIVPLNLLGYQNARTGIGYAGFFVFSGYGYYREYVQVMLSQPLRAGQAYCVDFFVSLSDSSEYAVTEIGAYFSVAPISSTGYAAFSYNPQITSLPGIYIIEKSGWMEISGILIASGGEQFLTIGSFKDSTNILDQYLGNLVSYQHNADSSSYYYLDDVSVTACDEMPIMPNVFTPNGDGINDAFIIDAKWLTGFSCTIFNRWGNEVANFTESGNSWDGKNKTGNDCPDGVYYYFLTGKGFDEKEYILKGFVQLMR